ncbi:hypothetical protein OG500_09480 [Kitasatospora sp. NBC_01250]|uniref:hypothetical protein n=1 Tax=unclassified Kitasatospora TaxID=2633591 RepID=UPI002E139347|nr:MULTISPECIES: hypothetical protein [unclassified Kitasatospora]WSJ66398.1 hypothetical protein OG294_09840 [Kitasatospora sp. NBC_01302]
MTSDLTPHQLTAARPPIAIDYHPIDGPAQQLLVSGEQLHADACLYCGTDQQQLHTAGHAYTHSGGLAWVVVACAAHLALGRAEVQAAQAAQANAAGAVPAAVPDLGAPPGAGGVTRAS